MYTPRFPHSQCGKLPQNVDNFEKCGILPRRLHTCLREKRLKRPFFLETYRRGHYPLKITLINLTITADGYNI